MPGLARLLSDYQALLVVRASVAAVAIVVLLWIQRARAANPRAERRRNMSLGALGVLAFAAWWNFGAFHPGGLYVHYHELFHYYLGAKFFPELGYTRLYDCVAAVDVEQGYRAELSKGWIRDLTTNELRLSSPSVANPHVCRDHFTPERWKAFGDDVAWFRSVLSTQKWHELKLDHGFNATPVWTFVAGKLANTGPVSHGRLVALALIDPLLLLVMWGAVWWAFGWRVLCVALVWWGTNYPARFTFIGGGFLRQDWLLLSVGGICLARRNRMGLAGFALAWSALLRVFPGFIVLGLVLKAAVGLLQKRRFQIEPSHLRFVVGAVLALAIFLPLSLTVGRTDTAGASAWRGFIANSRKHLSTPLTNNMGLKTVVDFEPSTRSVNLKKYFKDSAWDVWKDERRRVFNERWPLYAGLMSVFVLMLAKAAARSDDWAALVLGIGAIPFFTEITGYYYGILLGFGFLWPAIPAAGVGLAAVSALSTAVLVLPADDDRYAAISFAVVLFVAALTAWLAFRRQARASSSATPLAT